MRLISMDAKDLLIIELQAQLLRKDTRLDRIEAKLHEVASQHTWVTEQFSQALEEKDRKIALLESKIKRLLNTVRGSRQERVNPDQLLLFSQDELQQLAQELEKVADDNANQPDQEQEADQPQDPVTPDQPTKNGTGRRPLPSNWPKEICRHELNEEERKCPCCGKVRCESLIKTAFIYTLNQWEGLCRYTDAGYLSFENNAAERLVKHPAIGRKNYLFVGNERAGRNAANFYSLVTIAKQNGVEPFSWLKDVIEKLPYYRMGEAFSQSTSGESVTSSERDEMLPDRWLAVHPDCKWEIDAIRREERRQKEARKR